MWPVLLNVGLGALGNMSRRSGSLVPKNLIRNVIMAALVAGLGLIAACLLMLAGIIALWPELTLAELLAIGGGACALLALLLYWSMESPNKWLKMPPAEPLLSSPSDLVDAFKRGWTKG